MKTLIRKDGLVTYYGRVINPDYFTPLAGLAYANETVTLFGKTHVLKRKVYWAGEKEYAYSGRVKTPQPFTPELLEIKRLVEQLTGESFNACLVNYYPSGNEAMGWHSDDEASIVRDSAIASVSFGAERRFGLKHKASGEKVDVLLEDGSLLLMAGQTQTHWLHGLPKSAKVTQPRINLTFRKMA